MKYKEYNPNNNDMRTNYHLMISGIAPRPIAFVSSYDDDMNCNLAPFSFFNGFGANTPIVGFSPALSGRTGLEKDTLVNIRKTKEFTISIINSNMIEQASLASCEFENNIDEFIKTGLNKHKSKVVSVPSLELFKLQSQPYKIKILDETKYKVSIEAASTEPWKQLVGNNGLCFGIDRFGKSAPYKDIFKYLGLTSENIVNKIKKMINK